MTPGRGARTYGRLFAALLMLVLAGCSDDDAGSGDSAGTQAPATQTDDGSDSGDSAGTGTPDEAAPEEEREFDPFQYVIDFEFEGDPPPLESDLGPADEETAAALAADLVAAGVDLTGLELIVYDVNGSDDRLLVIDAGRSGEELSEDPEGTDITEALFSAPSFSEAGLTRLVFNLFGTDEEGAYVLTTTFPIEFLDPNTDLESLDEEELATLASSEVFRIDALPPPPPTSDTTAAPPTTTGVPDTLPPSGFFDTFDAPSTIAPLFPAGVMTTTITDDETLSIQVSTTGVIPATYPEALSSNVDIAFDFNAMPVGETSGFGALVLAESPDDNALNNYVAIWVTPSAGTLTIIPFDASTEGGWGEGTVASIPASVGFAAGQWHRMAIELRDGSIEVFLDDVSIANWNGSTPLSAGHWGPVIISSAAGEAMLVDNVAVEEVG